MVRGNRLVLENFLSLGLINVLNSSFHLIIYPILIHRVGAEAYGAYVYAFSIITYFTTLVTYGLDMIGTREVALRQGARPRRQVRHHLADPL